MGDKNSGIGSAFHSIAQGIHEAAAIINGEAIPPSVAQHDELKLVQSAIRLTILERGNQLENIYKLLGGLLPLERISELVQQVHAVQEDEPPATLYAPVSGVGAARYDGIGDGKRPVVMGEKPPEHGYYVPVDAIGLYNVQPIYRLMGICWIALRIPPEFIRQQGPIEGL